MLRARPMWLVVLALIACRAPDHSLHSPVITAGSARFTVLSPRLIRLEYAEDARFEDAPTFFATDRGAEPTAVASRSVAGWQEIATGHVVVRYKLGSGPFRADNTEITLDGRRLDIAWDGRDAPAHRAANLGGWQRDLGDLTGPAPLHDGLLSRDGWYSIDDASTPLWAGGAAFPQARPAHGGPYQDRYVFAYGDDYRGALRDFAHLTGPAPIVPRWALGIWFSRYHAYRDRDYHDMIERFHVEHVPLDVLVIDTDYKSPSDWNGWNWNRELFPDPESLLAFTRAEGLEVALNVHPSILASDPKFAEAQRIAGGLSDPGGWCPGFRPQTEPCAGWDWSAPKQERSYFALHEPFERAGVDLWWLDWCCDGSLVSVAGIAPDAWVNQRYAAHRQAQGRRGIVLSRVGGQADIGKPLVAAGPWEDHRSTIHFTGDTFPTWEMLAFEIEYTIREGNTGIPYTSHDVGSYKAGGPDAPELSPEMYVRWVQAATFQPIFRFHGLGNRLPWDFPEPAHQIAAAFLRLRAALVPYLYTLAHEAHANGLPMVRGMYLDHAGAAEAFQRFGQYMLGDALLIAPVTSAGSPAREEVWFPPGRWVDLFTAEVYDGPRVATLEVPLDRSAAFARAGAILPLAPAQDRVGVGAPASLILRVFAGASGKLDLYEDAGDGLGYLGREHATTQMRYREDRTTAELSIAAVDGAYPGAPEQRAYRVERIGPPPTRVRIDRELVTATAPGADHGWWYDASARAAIVIVPRAPTNRSHTLTFE